MHLITESDNQYNVLKDRKIYYSLSKILLGFALLFVATSCVTPGRVNYLQDMTLKGFGGTDFRPVFDYVEQLRQAGELTRLKGLIYFTDGIGVYPEQSPDYDTAFIFVEDENNEYNVPSWAMKLTLEQEEIL